MRANFVLSSVATGIRRNLTMTVALVLSTAIALGFVGAAILAKTEIGRFKDKYEGKINVSIYLCPKDFIAPCEHRTSPSETAAIQNALAQDPMVQSYKYLSEQAVYDQQKKYQDPLVLKTGVFKPGVLPATFIVHLKDLRKDFTPFATKYRNMAGVGYITNRDEAIKALLDVIDSVLTVSLLLAIVVLVASALLIANTIQVAANQRKEETGIMRLVGASRWMTELPFMLEAMISTVIGGLLALGAISLLKAFIFDHVFHAQTQRSVIPNLDVNDVLIAGGGGLAVGIVLSAITAFATLRLLVKL
jgi:cell division transport system permease protein